MRSTAPSPPSTAVCWPCPTRCASGSTRWSRAASVRTTRTLPDLDELLAEYQKRLGEQTERHDGGPYWIGTGGTSPFGQGGAAGGGLSTGSSGGGRSAIQIADARQYRRYRSDVTLDIRQLEMALRRLRAFVREGADDELDIDATIDATARNAGEIEVVTRPPSRPNTHVILMIDVGGSMHPYRELMSQLFSATKKATHFKELRTYYFHNCVYGQVYGTTAFAEPITLPDLMSRCAAHYKLIMVGDALMAPYELTMGGHWSPEGPDSISGLGWLHILRDHFTDAVWLNPEPSPAWGGTTIEAISEAVPMFPLTVDGLTEGMALLNRGARRWINGSSCPPSASRWTYARVASATGARRDSFIVLDPITSRRAASGWMTTTVVPDSRTCAISRSRRSRTGARATVPRSIARRSVLDIGADTTTRSSPIPATRSRLWIDHIPPSTCRWPSMTTGAK